MFVDKDISVGVVLDLEEFLRRGGSFGSSDSLAWDLRLAGGYYDALGAMRSGAWDLGSCSYFFSVDRVGSGECGVVGRMIDFGEILDFSEYVVGAYGLYGEGG